MLKMVRKCLKKIVFAFGIIYGVNVILKSTGIYIPINIPTMTIASFLGIPGILSLFAIFFIIR